LNEQAVREYTQNQEKLDTGEQGLLDYGGRRNLIAPFKGASSCHRLWRLSLTYYTLGELPRSLSPGEFSIAGRLRQSAKAPKAACLQAPLRYREFGIFLFRGSKRLPALKYRHDMTALGQGPFRQGKALNFCFCENVLFTLFVA